MALQPPSGSEPVLPLCSALPIAHSQDHTAGAPHRHRLCAGDDAHDHHQATQPSSGRSGRPGKAGETSPRIPPQAYSPQAPAHAERKRLSPAIEPSTATDCEKRQTSWGNVKRPEGPIHHQSSGRKLLIRAARQVYEDVFGGPALVYRVPGGSTAHPGATSQWSP